MSDDDRIMEIANEIRSEVLRLKANLETLQTALEEVEIIARVSEDTEFYAMIAREALEKIK